MDTELLQNINKNLEIIIGLIVRTLPDAQGAGLRGRIVMLKGMGVRPVDIAKILGKSTNQVNVTLSQSRNPKKKPKRKRSKR